MVWWYTSLLSVTRHKLAQWSNEAQFKVLGFGDFSGGVNVFGLGNDSGKTQA